MIRESFTAADMAAPFAAAPHGWHSQRDVPVVMKPRPDVVFYAELFDRPPDGYLARPLASWSIRDPRKAAARVREVARESGVQACHDCGRLATDGRGRPVLRESVSARNLPRCRGCTADFLRRYSARRDAQAWMER